MTRGNFQLPNSNQDEQGNPLYPAQRDKSIWEPYIWDEVIESLQGAAVSIDDTDSPYTAQRTDSLILVDTTNGPVTINLPPASDVVQMQFHIHKTTEANTITVVPDGADTIRGDASLTINFEGSTATIQSTGVDEWVTV